MCEYRMTADMLVRYMVDSPDFEETSGVYASYGEASLYIRERFRKRSPYGPADGTVADCVKFILSKYDRKDHDGIIAKILTHASENDMKPKRKGWYAVYMKKNIHRPYLRYWNGSVFKRGGEKENNEDVIAWMPAWNLRDAAHMGDCQ